MGYQGTLTPPGEELAATKALSDATIELTRTLQGLQGRNAREAYQPSDELARALAWIAEAEQLMAEQRQRIDQLEGMVMTDELTGLYNRRGFIKHLTRELAITSRVDENAGMLMLIDLDSFKAINDTYGHPAGDACLETVARFLVHSLRDMDIVARQGGDEFAVILPRISRQNAKRRAKALADALNSLTFRWQGRDIPLAGSTGTSLYASGDSLDDVIARADRALYADKERRKAVR